MSSVLEEVVSVEGNDTGLIGLSDIGDWREEKKGRKGELRDFERRRKIEAMVLTDNVDHGEEHTVLVRVSGILNDG